jgi:pimeloyl-ACP methyl ester carboxylesterase
MSEPIGALGELWTLVDGRPLFARRSVDPPPDAPPVVLVHGFAISGRSLLPTAARLAPFFPTYVPDLPGFGRSPKPDSSLSVPELAETLAAWLTAVGIERALLIGSSMGCQVIAELAHQAPALVERVVLVGPSGEGPAARLAVQIGRLALDGLREPFGLARIAIEDYLRFGPIRALRLLRSMDQHPLEERLRRMHVPALLVVGGRDPIVTKEQARRLARLLPCGRLVVVPDVAHAVTYSAPDRIARLVRGFAGAAGGEEATWHGAGE